MPDHTGRYSCAAISADATLACRWQAEIRADCRLSAKNYGGERPHSLTLAQSDIARVNICRPAKGLYVGAWLRGGAGVRGHESLVSVELWERVQGVMGGRFTKKRRRMTHDFAFSGLIACSRCGCSAVGEIKKQRYVYYHCTGYADKCQGNPASCRRKHVREEALEAQFTELLGRLRFDDEVLGWVREALHASHAGQRREHQAAIERLRAEHRRLGDRVSAMYIDKLDGKICGDFYDQMAGEWREEQRRLQREIDRHETAEQSYMDEGVQILELAQNAQRLFEQQEPRQKRRLLNFLLSNCSWEDGEVIATFRQPFDLLAETTAIVARHSAGDTANSAKRENWLAFNHRTLASSAPTSSDRSNKLALFERHAHSASR